MSGAPRASDVFVECLEAEGVRYVFGIPGEETLDLNQSLANSSVAFVPVRHEQGGAYMADMYGRLTGRAGVCLGTLGPGAMNLVTAIGDAFLDRAPLVALTGQADLERMHKESHQFIDLVELFRPITKWNARVTSPEIIPEVVRKAFKVAESEKPGATHLELPEDVMAAERRRRAAAAPAPGQPRARARASCSRPPTSSATRSTRSCWPATASCAPAPRPRCASSAARPASRWPRRSWARACSTTQDPQALGTVGLQSRDYAMAGFEDADVVHRDRLRPRRARAQALEPRARQEDRRRRLRARRDRRVLHARGRARRRHLPRAHAPGRGVPRRPALRRLAAAARRRARPLRGRPRTTTHFPMQPPRVLWEIRQALGREDILISDVGLHKLWIGRMFPAHEPNTVMIANGLAGMGFAVPCAIAAKLVHPDRKVVTVNGDGGFLMNCQELETAMRLRTPIVNVVWENQPVRLDRLEAGQEVRRALRRRLHEPRLRQARRGLRDAGLALRGGRGLRPHLRHALTLDVPSLIVVPIDYSIDVRLAELGAETVSA